MKALVLTEYNKFDYLDVPTPTPGTGEVLIKVKACAVCGSDVHGMDGSSGRRQPPDIMGHEASGQIEAVGPGVEGWSVGDRVTFDSTVYCNQCDACLAGNVNLCTNRQVLGVSCDDYRRDGAFADYLVVPAYICYRLPDEVSYVQAAMVEPLAIAYHAATRTPVKPGMSAVIVGVGTIGLLTLQVVKAMGAGPIIAVDIRRPWTMVRTPSSTRLRPMRWHTCWRQPPAARASTSPSMPQVSKRPSTCPSVR